MLVNKFDGGLNTRVAPQFLQTTEAVVYTNIDNASKVLQPVKGTTEVELAVNNYPYWYEEGDKWLFASGECLPRTKLSGKVYEATAVDLQVYNPTSNRAAGVAQPTTPTVVGQGAPGKIAGITLTPVFSADILHLPRASYAYLLLNRNASGYSQGTSVTVKPTGPSSISYSNYHKGDAAYFDDYEGVTGFYSPDHQTVTVGPINASIAGAYGVDVFRLFDGVHRLVGTLTSSTATFVDSTYDISANAALDADNFSKLLGYYQYVTTHVNSDGIESVPSAVSTELDLSVGGNVQLTFPSYGAAGGKIRIYRVGGNLTAFTLVAEIAGSNTNYLDNIPDTEVEGTVLYSQNYDVAPAPMTSITTAYAMLFASVGSTLHFTNPGEPEYWPTAYAIPFPSEITGLATIANGLLVMTKTQTHLVSGTGPLVLSVQVLSSDQGCLDPKSVQVFRDNAIWATSEGIAVSGGEGVTVITKDKLAKLDLASVRSSVLYDEVYYLSYDSNKVLAADFRFNGLTFKTFDFSVVGPSATVTFFRDSTTLYIYSATKKYKLFDSGTESFNYTSPRFIEGKCTENKNYKKFYFYVEGEVTINILIDDVIVAAKTTAPDTKDAITVQVPQPVQRGFFVQFNISGTGKVYEYEYMVMSRTNA